MVPIQAGMFVLGNMYAVEEELRGRNRDVQRIVGGTYRGSSEAMEVKVRGIDCHRRHCAGFAIGLRGILLPSMCRKGKLVLKLQKQQIAGPDSQGRGAIAVLIDIAIMHAAVGIERIAQGQSDLQAAIPTHYLWGGFDGSRDRISARCVARIVWSGPNQRGKDQSKRYKQKGKTTKSKLYPATRSSYPRSIWNYSTSHEPEPWAMVPSGGSHPFAESSIGKELWSSIQSTTVQMASDQAKSDVPVVRNIAF